jgi:hypothetical protein
MQEVCTFIFLLALFRVPVELDESDKNLWKKRKEGNSKSLSDVGLLMAAGVE